MQTIYVDRVIGERNVDAALYILAVLLGLADDVLGGRRDQLTALKQRLEAKREITEDDQRDLVKTYNEVMYQ